MLPPLARVGIAALMLSSFPLKAVAQVLDDTSEGGNVTLAPRYDQDDCEFAKLQWLDADCHYEFHDADGGWLRYQMFLMPNGMQDDVQRWCQGIFDNIRGECDPGAVDPRHPSTNANNWGWKGCEEYITRELHHPITHEVRHSKGVKFEVHWDWPWVEGEDQRSCFKSAIEKASCGAQGAPITFKNDGCYKTN